MYSVRFCVWVYCQPGVAWSGAWRRGTRLRFVAWRGPVALGKAMSGDVRAHRIGQCAHDLMCMDALRRCLGGAAGPAPSDRRFLAAPRAVSIERY